MSVFIRLIGLIALFWTNWIIALIALFALGNVGSRYSGGKYSIIKNDNARVAVEIITSILAVIGIWYFPLVPAVYAHIAAVVAGVATFVDLFSGLTG